MSSGILFLLPVDSEEALNKQLIGLEDDKNMTRSLREAKNFFWLLFADKLDSSVISQVRFMDLI